MCIDATKPLAFRTVDDFELGDVFDHLFHCKVASGVRKGFRRRLLYPFVQPGVGKRDRIANESGIPQLVFGQWKQIVIFYIRWDRIANPRDLSIFRFKAILKHAMLYWQFVGVNLENEGQMFVVQVFRWSLRIRPLDFLRIGIRFLARSLGNTLTGSRALGARHKKVEKK